ncbi:MAG TPA: alanine racemase [Gammaproteobacteria bacterium]|nr:alanine racemase [Gammaproteobacteria bacterium]
MTRPVRARINLQALAHNLSLARKAAPDSRIMAVVKANAYGHGVVPVARALAGADALGVASLEEAMQLREAGIRHEIVLLEGVFDTGELELAVTHQLQLVVHCEEQVRWLEKFRSGASVHLWLKVDTGMNRLGFAPDVAQAVWQRLQRLSYVKTGGLRWMSHLACADDTSNSANDRQLARFTDVIRFSESLQGTVVEGSLANSAALLTRTDMHFNWVRPGIMLYGASPMLPEHKLNVALRPVMTLESKLIAVHQRRKNDSIGYGQTWACPEDMSVGIVAVGYGDGYPRHAPNETPLLVNGKPVALLGRVSMDMLCVDLRSQPQAKPGDLVVLWGEGLPVEALARQAGTISYELFCNLSPRVPRSYG